MHALFAFDFAYTCGMQLILFIVSCATSFLFYHLITNIVLKLYAQSVPLARRLGFVCVTSLLLNTAWTYGVYLIGGRMHFPPMVYALVTVPNPIFAMLIYLSGVKILRLSPYRSLRIMDLAYIYYVAIKVLLRFIGAMLFAQPGGAYNYMLDTASLLLGTAVILLIYLLTMLSIDRHRFVIQLTEQIMVTSLPKALMRSFLKDCAVYAMVIALPLIDPDVYVHLFTAVILFMSLIISIQRDSHEAMTSEVSNREAYIDSLMENMDRFRGLRHDINNMLLTYEGYIELGDLDSLKQHHQSLVRLTNHTNTRMAISMRMKENPALVSVLSAKLDYAEELGVELEIGITCDMDLYIDNLDACRSVACLLDNAIEAAALSAQRSAMLSIERKPDGAKLIIIKNSTLETVDVGTLAPDKSTKPGHTGIGLHQVRKTLRRYGNCSFHLTASGHSFTVYMAIRPLEISANRTPV